MGCIQSKPSPHSRPYHEPTPFAASDPYLPRSKSRYADHIPHTDAPDGTWTAADYKRAAWDPYGTPAYRRVYFPEHDGWVDWARREGERNSSRKRKGKGGR
ncbi:hypothetical protein MMC28_006825 [Mycoblastus sanguinarius]|nr:hypothetical protein [Mycoblastus sanguinarius]